MKVMGIDIGTTTISMVLTEADTGKMIAKETVEHRSFLKSEIPEQKIQDPERIYEIVTELANRMEKEYGLPDGIGFTGQMHGMLYVDASGRAVSPLYTWQDGSGELLLENGESSVQLLKEVGAAASGYGIVTHFYLPEVRSGHFLAGKTEKGVPVMGSVGDNQASLFGSVRDLKDTVLLNVGTGSQISFVTEDFVKCGGSVELRPCTENSYILVGASLCGGRAYAMLEQFYREIAAMGNGTGAGSLYAYMQEQAEAFLEKYGEDAAWKVDTAFSGTRSDPSRRGMITGIGVENFHPGAMTVGVIRGILEELHNQYEQMCRLTGKKAIHLAGSGNGIRRNPLMRKMAEKMFGMPMDVAEYEEEAAYGAAVCAWNVIAEKQK